MRLGDVSTSVPANSDNARTAVAGAVAVEAMAAAILRSASVAPATMRDSAFRRLNASSVLRLR